MVSEVTGVESEDTFVRLIYAGALSFNVGPCTPLPEPGAFVVQETRSARLNRMTLSKCVPPARFLVISVVLSMLKLWTGHDSATNEL